MKKEMNDISSKLMFNTLKNYMNLIMAYHFYQKELDLKKPKSFLQIYMIKVNMSRAQKI